MIFLSHTHADKAIVEPIAIKLRSMFGEANVFYDSWSIQPGDGIIEKMNEGLADFRYFFYFVSSASLNSKMVDLEWQNGLLKATNADCKLVPVRLDSSSMPPILAQTVYIDLYQQGVDFAAQQMLGVIQGTRGFEPAHSNFSNLTWTEVSFSHSEVVIRVQASHYVENNVSILLMLENQEGELELDLVGYNMSVTNFFPDQVVNGKKLNGFYITIPGGMTVSPTHPLDVRLSMKSAKQTKLEYLMYEHEKGKFKGMPKAVSLD